MSIFVFALQLRENKSKERKTKTKITLNMNRRKVQKEVFSTKIISFFNPQYAFEQVYIEEQMYPVLILVARF
jgi:uncharacterized protein YwgA